MTNNISLYFHIPFCIKKCEYCAFYSLPNQSEETKQEYFEALQRQIDFFDDERKIKTVYFGGGTPTALGIERLCALIEKVVDSFDFSSDFEITVEVNPKTIDFDGLVRLRSAGANRLSVGIQSANDRILSLLGRIHSFKDAKDCIRDASLAGFDNISADVIFALPEQTDEEFMDSVISILSTDVNHVSAYSLQLEEGTPLFSKRDKLNFPNEDGEEAQYGFLCEHLVSNGFTHYEISSFAKNGFESKHNLNYWDCGEFFGFGAGAHSYYRGKRFSAEPNITQFIEKSCISLFAPTDFEEADVLTDEEKDEERIMLGLRTNRGAVIPQKSFPVAEKIARLGYGVFENGVLRLNSKGFRVSNSIIAEILI